jgi:hypothetical protein
LTGHIYLLDKNDMYWLEFGSLHLGNMPASRSAQVGSEVS